MPLQTSTIRGAMGACYGFAIGSSVELRGLRGGEGPLLTVHVSERDPSPSGAPLLARTQDGKPFLRLFDLGGRFAYWMAGVGWFEIDPALPAISVPRSSSGAVREMRLWGLPSALCYIERGDQPLHAAAIEIDGAAILLAAPGRFGKTTLAAACVRAGHRLLSEDLACCRVEGASACVIPGPAILRLRHDVVDGLELPGARAIDEDHDRVYVATDERTRGDCSPVPLRAVVLLREHDGPPRLEPVPPERALPDVWTLAFRLPNERDVSRCFGAVAAMAAAVPVFNLHRRMSLSDLPATVDLLERRPPAARL